MPLARRKPRSSAQFRCLVFSYLLPSLILTGLIFAPYSLRVLVFFFCAGREPTVLGAVKLTA